MRRQFESARSHQLAMLSNGMTPLCHSGIEAGSIPVLAAICRHLLKVRKPGFHLGNAGSIPADDTNLCRVGQHGELSGLENRRSERTCRFESYTRRHMLSSSHVSGFSSK